MYNKVIFTSLVFFFLINRKFLEYIFDVVITYFCITIFFTFYHFRQRYIQVRGTCLEKSSWDLEFVFWDWEFWRNYSGTLLKKPPESEYFSKHLSRRKFVILPHPSNKNLWTNLPACLLLLWFPSGTSAHFCTLVCICTVYLIS